MFLDKNQNTANLKLRHGQRAGEARRVNENVFNAKFEPQLKHPGTLVSVCPALWQKDFMVAIASFLNNVFVQKKINELKLEFKFVYVIAHEIITALLCKLFSLTKFDAITHGMEDNTK